MIALLLSTAALLWLLKRYRGVQRIALRHAAHQAAALELEGETVEALRGTLEGGHGVEVSLKLGVPVLAELRVLLDIPKSVSARRGNLISRERFLLGDPVFDLNVSVTGPPNWLCSRLDVSTRWALRAWISEGAQIKEGVLSAQRPLTRRRGLGAILAELGELADALVEGDTARRLFINCQRDPLPEVRRNCLERLLSHHRRSLEARLAMEAAVKGSDVKLKLMAAKGLGAAGKVALEEICLERLAPDEARLEAWRALTGWQAPRVEVISALLEGGGRLRGLAIEALGAHPQRGAALDLLASTLNHADAEDLARIRRALERQRAQPEEIELHLARLLRKEDPALQREAVEALGDLGGPAAAMALGRLRRRVTWSEPRMTRVLEAALARLAARHPALQAGGLSLEESAEEDRGRLSLSAQEGGLSAPQKSSSGSITLSSRNSSSSSSSGSGSA